MIAAALLVMMSPLPASGRGHTVMEEKMSFVFKLNAQRQRWGDVFDAVAAAALVIAVEDGLTDDDHAQIVVAALLGSPNHSIIDMTGLVMTIGDAIAGGERDVLVRMIESGRPRADHRTWATAGKMVEIVRRVRGMDEPTVDRVIATIRLIGEHPLFLGFPS